MVKKKVQDFSEDEPATGIPPPKVWQDGVSFRVNCLDGHGVKELRTNLIMMAHSLPWWHQVIPQAYKRLQEHIEMRSNQKTFYLDWREYVEISKECCIASTEFFSFEKQLEMATKFLHETAVLKFFGEYPKNPDEHAEVCEYVYINPTWIIDALKGCFRMNALPHAGVTVCPVARHGIPRAACSCAKQLRAL